MTGLVVVNIPPPSQYLNIPALLSDLGSHPQHRIYTPLSSGDIMELYEFSQNHPRTSRVTAVEFDGEGQWESIYFRSTE